MSEPADFTYKNSIHIFLFFLFFILLNWPFITVATRHADGGGFFLYAFAIWSILVLSMFIAGMTYSRRIDSPPHEEDPVS